MKYDLIAEAYKKLLKESIKHPMIEVDGVMRHRHNSLGQPIHPTDEGIRNFYRWFGNAHNIEQKLVNGQWTNAGPNVLYHETNSDNIPSIKEHGFNITKISNRASDEQMPNGIFLKNNKERIGVSRKDKEYQIPVYARNKNPIYFYDRNELESHMMANSPEYKLLRKQHTDTDDYYNSLIDQQWKNLGIGTEEEQNRKDSEHENTLHEWETKINEISAKMRDIITNHLKSKGYDSLAMTNDVGSNGRSTMTQVIFDPNDIKHASENDGSFANNTKIYEEYIKKSIYK